LASRWDGIITPDDLAALTAALAGLPAPPHRVLDVGTGTGAAAFLVANTFPQAEVVGVDVSARMVSLAAAKAKTIDRLAGRVRFIEADAARLPLPDGAYDLITLSNMIPFFDEIARVLASSGTVLISFAEGTSTPIWVSSKRLQDELAKRGFTLFAESNGGAATCLSARRP
jgi:ubiquinone/menaquinone biosynthesis C-methylase UbiE